MPTLNKYRSKEIIKPLTSKNLLAHGATDWNIKFINIKNIKELEVLIVASGFLDIEAITDLGCAHVVSKIKGKSVY